MDCASAPQTRTGDRVYVMSGPFMGTVANTSQQRFEVLTADGRRLWLRNDAIFTADFGRVLLVCEQAGLSAYQD